MSKHDIGQANKRRRLKQTAEDIAGRDTEYSQQLDSMRADDTYYPPKKPRPVARHDWRTDDDKEYPVTVTRIGDQS